MSGVVAPLAWDVVAGLGLDVAWKTSVPLALGLAMSALPGTAAARHARLVAGCLAVPAVALATVFVRGADAAVVGAAVWPFVVWAVGAGLMGARVVAAWWGITHLPATAWSAGVEVSEAVSTPLTAGWWRPRIVVPADFDGWTPAQREAALAHERAHVARRDWVTHMGVWMLGALLWFHPLMWLTRHRLALLAECAADDAVIAEGHDPVSYAEQLVAQGTSWPSAALAMGRSVLVSRVAAVLDGRPRRGASRIGLVFATLAMMAVSWWTVGVQAWSAPEPVVDCLPSPDDGFGG